MVVRTLEFRHREINLHSYANMSPRLMSADWQGRAQFPEGKPETSVSQDLLDHLLSVEHRSSVLRTERQGLSSRACESAVSV
jgi:hypothetical protein